MGHELESRGKRCRHCGAREPFNSPCRGSAEQQRIDVLERNVRELRELVESWKPIINRVREEHADEDWTREHQENVDPETG